jgi:hypothetical protein
MSENVPRRRVHLLSSECMSEESEPYLAAESKCVLQLSGGSVEARIKVFPKRISVKSKKSRSYR